MQDNEGMIENQFEEKPNPKAKKTKRKQLIFAVAEPKSEKTPIILFDVLEKRENTLLLHNRYNYANETGQAASEISMLSGS